MTQIKNLKNKHNQTFNIGGGLRNKISLKQLTQKCQKTTGNIIKIGKVKKTSKFDIPFLYVIILK